MNPIVAEKDGGEESLRTGTSCKEDVTLDALLDPRCGSIATAAIEPSGPRESPPWETQESESQEGEGDRVGGEAEGSEEGMIGRGRLDETESNSRVPSVSDKSSGPVTTPPGGVFQKENKGDNLTAWNRGAKRTSGSSAGGIDTVLERMEEQDEIYRKMEKRKLELQEEDMQERQTERHRSAMRERFKATREEAVARLAVEKLPWAVLIREAEERYDQAMAEED